MEGTSGAGGFLELIVYGVLALPGRGPASRFAPPHGSLRRARPASSHARCQTFLGPGPLKRAVGCSFPRVRSTMPVSSRGPRRCRSWWCHTCSSTPNTCTPAKRAGSSDAACRHGLIWDHTVFHVVASCRARPAIVAPSKRNCRIAQRIARPPRRALGAHTRSSCSRNVTVWQACSRHIQRRLNHRSLAGTPGPGRVDHLHDHAPVALYDSARNPGAPPAGCATQHRVPEHMGCGPRSSPSKPTSRSQRSSDTQQQQVG